MWPLRCFLLLLLQSLFQHTVLASPLCHDNERRALLQFKGSFIVDHRRPSSTNPCAYPKTDYWPEFGEVDCCSWGGVECDRNTGHVIGLDLSSSCIYGSLNSSTALFHLVHLRKLNLAYNHFNYSVIPSSFGNLSMLTHLNLSSSGFHGQIPSEISKLFRLSSLDLSHNFELKIPDLSSLIQNLTSLEDLDLCLVDIASPIPSVFSNLSSLRSLRLAHCGLLGEFPIPIFHLPNLQSLWLENNSGLTGYLPEFNFSSKVKILVLFNTSFSGELQTSIGELQSLELLGIGNCNFTGLLPSTLGNLPNLRFLDIGNNHFRGLLPSTLGNLTKLQILYISYNFFTVLGMDQWLLRLYRASSNYLLQNLIHGNYYFAGEFPASIGKLISLEALDIRYCNFTGSVPPMLGNLTNLKDMKIGHNLFRGSLLSSIFRLKKLEFFGCGGNWLNGTVEFDAFLELKQLKSLFLSFNNFFFISRNNTIATNAPQLINLGLRYCVLLKEIPYFIRNQHQLQVLDLSSSNIQGMIPKWMSEVSIETLWFLDLSNNSLTGFDDGFPVVLPWSNIYFLKLSSNFLKGSLPLPPFSTVSYFISNNSLTGEIPKLLCNQTSLSFLDISDNNLSGEIPECLSNFSKSLVVLTAGANNLHGPIPGGWANGNRLKMIDFSNNNLEGRIPRSLVECRMLEYLDLGNNRISDAFPSWLGSLPELNVLLLSFNQFYGKVGNFPYDVDQSNDSVTFPVLRIIDLSYNKFNGSLPSGYFERWNAMRSLDHNTRNSLSYMIEELNMNINVVDLPRIYAYSMTITNKGRQMEYTKIIRTLVAIDLSSNRFDGEIPESIGNLKELHLLNLSNNNIIGQIPLPLTKLTNLETLDLSRNKLAGGIPWQLAQLNFLVVLDLSWNRLSGPIPQGGQFETLQSSSFDGNVGLCGKQLIKKCEDSESGALPPYSSGVGGFKSLVDEISWIVVLVGYACGLPMGIVIFNVIRKQYWFERMVWKIERKRQRRGRQ